jgi:hypothetical protein
VVLGDAHTGDFQERRYTNDHVVPFEATVEVATKSGLPTSALIEVGRDHRLADPEPLEALLRAVEGR